MTHTPFVTRFAPSPTGRLHLGHAFSALMAFNAAKAAGGRFLLRIEDIDLGRCKPAFEAAIYDDLAWLGLEWETPVRRQSDHFTDYQAALEVLRSKGVVYRCFKTRRAILEEIARAPHPGEGGPDGPAYTGAPLAPSQEQTLIAQGKPFAWRLSMTRARDALGATFGDLAFTVEDLGGDGRDDARRRHVAARPEIFGDAVIARKDAGASYHLASVHDDAAQGVTHVIRGDDLATSAHLHTLLQALLDLPRPVYRHHHLITDDSGQRLAKRDRAATLEALRNSAHTPGDILRQLGLAPR